MVISETATLPIPPSPPESVLRERNRLLEEAKRAQHFGNLLLEGELSKDRRHAHEVAAATLDGYARGLNSVGALVYRLWRP